VHENVLKRAEQDKTQAFKLSNALSPDLQYYRLSVLPSLLDKVHANIKAGHDEFVLFEIGKGHNKKYHLDDDAGLPKELNFVDAVYASKKPGQGAPYYRIRKLVEQLCLDRGVAVVYKPITDELDFPVTAPFDLARSALLETTNGVFIGMIGELKQRVLKNFKLPSYTAAMTLDLEGLEQAFSQTHQTYRPLSKYPSIFQDISLKVPGSVAFGEVAALVREVSSGAAEMAIRVSPVSIYQPEGDTSTKTMTMRLRCVSYEKTLTDHDLKPIIQRVVDAAQKQYGAEVA
jgi:phenylalanyl-tRNA synthetase beta chain